MLKRKISYHHDPVIIPPSLRSLAYILLTYALLTYVQAAHQAALAKENANGGASKTDDADKDKKGGHNKRRGRAAATPPVDNDPLGLTLLEKDPLPEAARLVALLSAHAGAFVETHLLAFDVAMKRGKYMLAARAVVRCVWMECVRYDVMCDPCQFFLVASSQAVEADCMGRKVRSFWIDREVGSLGT